MRSIEDLGYAVDPAVAHAVKLLTQEYGAGPPHDSGHTKSSPTWIYRCDAHQGAEVGVRMNKECLTIYMRDRTLDGRNMSSLVPEKWITKRYPRDGRPAESVYKSSFLRPSASNELLMLNISHEDVASVLTAFFGQAGSEGALPTHSSMSGASSMSPAGLPASSQRPTVSAEAFQASLDRRSDVGAQGEGVAVFYEMERLRACGCPDPEAHVERVALTDVGRGYDILSSWPGQERCIEVKTTVNAGADFFITRNEMDVLGALGNQAWIYRVVLRADGSAAVDEVGPDPIARLRAAPELMSPVVWSVCERAMSAIMPPAVLIDTVVQWP